MSTLNLGTIKTPGVYIDEMSLFPPSVAQVDTSVPAFIGPTAQPYKTGQPVKIASMAEYRSFYGGGPARELTVELDARNTVQSVTATASEYLFDSLQLFFANGGQKCYIVSTGTYTQSAPGPQAYIDALEQLRKFDEPTLIVMPDAVRLGDNDLLSVQQEALSHCHLMQDRFAILDVKMDAANATPSSQDIKDTIDGFRDNIGNNYLNYGAAYYPYLQTTLPLSVSYRNLTIEQGGIQVPVSTLVGSADATLTTTINTLEALIADRDEVSTGIPTTAGFEGAGGTVSSKLNFVKTSLTNFATLTPSAVTASFAAYNTSTSHTKLVADINAAIADTHSTMALALDLYAKASSFTAGFIDQIDSLLQASEAELIRKSPLYANIVKAVGNQGIVLPPSGAVAGAYARTDSDRGVWKSPANVSLNYVAGPLVALTDAEQDELNVDPIAGKSINAIRAFTGKGTLVWGGRTLAGSDNEWRYVSVRRFFLMAEESIKKATAQFVFEANDANTWVRVRAMVENFLTLQWRAGALAGNKADNAFFVRVGLGQTMTPQDVLNGLMIVEIGMAVVRPAEFIVLRFSHKMQEA